MLLSVCDTPAFSISQTFCRQDGGIASPPSLACTSPPKPALSLAPHHVLASLVKGEVLSPEKIRATTGGIASPPSFACTNPPNPAIFLAQHHVLASLVKGEVLSPEKNSGDYRRDCSLSAPSMRFSALSHEKHQHPYLARSSRCTEPFHPHNLLKTTSTASPRTISLPPLSKVRCCRPKKFGRLPEGLLYTHQPLHPPQPLQNHNRPSPRTTSLPCLPPLHRILLPSHLSFLFNILITANFNFAVYHIDGILSFPTLP